MKISVLMSVYNKERPEYLKESLKSILEQTYKPNEIILVKDGVLNEELERVIANYKEKNPNIIKTIDLPKQENLGNVLKIGVEHCNNEYIARMDTDDVSLKDRFEKQVKYLEKHPEIDLLGGYIEEYDEKLEKIIDIKKVPLNLKQIKKILKRECPFNHGTVILKKSKVLEVGNYQNVIIEDYDLWARMIIKGAIAENLPEVLVKNRTGKAMYERRGSKRRQEGIKEFQQRLLQYGVVNKMEYKQNLFLRLALAKTSSRAKSILYPMIRKFVNKFLYKK